MEFFGASVMFVYCPALSPDPREPTNSTSHEHRFAQRVALVVDEYSSSTFAIVFTA